MLPIPFTLLVACRSRALKPDHMPRTKRGRLRLLTTSNREVWPSCGSPKHPVLPTSGATESDPEAQVPASVPSSVRLSELAIGATNGGREVWETCNADCAVGSGGATCRDKLRPVATRRSRQRQQRGKVDSYEESAPVFRQQLDPFADRIESICTYAYIYICLRSIFGCRHMDWSARRAR